MCKRNSLNSKYGKGTRKKIHELFFIFIHVLTYPWLAGLDVTQNTEQCQEFHGTRRKKEYHKSINLTA